MAIAQTANLAVELTLGGNFNAGLTSAESNLSRFNTVAATSGARTGIVAGAFGAVERASIGLGGALSHAGSQLKNLITGPLGIIGLTGGLLSFGGAISSTLGKLNDLAFGTEKLQALTGDSAQSLSTLIAATEKYGLTLDNLTTIAGFYEKNVDKVIASGKAADVVLTDATGKALPFSEALLNVADAYSQNADKAAAATEAAALFGRGYTAIVPVLELGKQGIIDLENEAAKMGLQLSDKNIADFAKYRSAIRASQESIAGLEVAIGEDLLPTITELADGISRFVSGHKDDIVNFFHNAVQAGKEAAKTIGGFASTVAGFWNSIPPGFRDLLVKGFVADKTIKFLFGFDPIKTIGSALFGGGIGGFLQRGSSPGNPVFVSGGIGGAGGAAGLAGLIGGAAIAVSIVGIAAEVADALGFRQQRQDIASNFGLTNAQALAIQVEAHGGLQSYDTRSRSGIAQQFINAGTTYNAALAAAHALMNLTDKLVQTQNAGDKYIRDNTDALKANTDALNPRDYALTAGRQKLIDEIRAASAARYGGTGLGPAAVEATYERRLLFATERIMDNGQSNDEKIGELRDIESQLLSQGDTKTRKRIDALILKLQNEKPPVVNVTNNVSVSGTGMLATTTTRILSGSHWVIS